MRMLYGIQGTGHGHLSRAKELLPELCRHGQVDVLISGYNCQLELQGEVAYRKRGISLHYDRRGGVAVLQTLRQFKPIRFLSDIQSIPLERYELVISDYEPVSSWAARIAGVPGVALSHQAAFLSERTPRPERRSVVAEQLLQHFAPGGLAIGFHFRRYDTFIEPPLIRQEIRQLQPTDAGHITVYLPAYHPAVLARLFRKFPQAQWHVFSPDCRRPQQLQNVTLRPVGNRAFLDSLASCSGVMTSAGFELASEAMFLGKKLAVVPIRNQYEQQCNAAALAPLGVTVLEDPDRQKTAVARWLEGATAVPLPAVADPQAVVNDILNGNDEPAAPGSRRPRSLSGDGF